MNPINSFAHNGVEHSSTAETISHSESTAWPVILAVTIVAMILIFVAYRLLAKGSDPGEED